MAIKEERQAQFLELLNSTEPLESGVLAGDLRKKSVCLFALNKEGKVLAVARRGTTDAWGLPGGKVDLGEDMIEALVREVYEETYIKLDADKLEPVFERVDPPYFVVTYSYKGEIKEDPRQGDAGSVGWVTWDELLSGPFGEYNARLKTKLGL